MFRRQDDFCNAVRVNFLEMVSIFRFCSLYLPVVLADLPNFNADGLSVRINFPDSSWYVLFGIPTSEVSKIRSVGDLLKSDLRKSLSSGEGDSTLLTRAKLWYDLDSGNVDLTCYSEQQVFCAASVPYSVASLSELLDYPEEIEFEFQQLGKEAGILEFETRFYCAELLGRWIRFADALVHTQITL